MHPVRSSKRFWLGLALVSVLVLTGCERTAALIPGDVDNPRTPPPTPSPDATPILVTPGLSVSPSGTPAAAIPDHELARSVVQILGIDLSAGFEQVTRYGSGVVVDTEQRLVLTSYPVVAPFRGDGSTAYSTLVVATNADPGSPAVREYEAEILAANVDTGVAVLRLTGRTDDTPAGIAGFDLPAVAIGQATGITAGVPVRLFGHVGGNEGTDPVSVTGGRVSGQRGAAGQTGRTWFKTDARLPAGVAGGPAFDQQGALIGMLAQEEYVPQGQVGQIRPADLLTPVIDQARTATRPFDPPLYRGTTVASDGIWVSRPAFAGNAVESASGRDLFDYNSRFNEGLAALYYEYAVVGVSSGTPIEERWYLEGVIQDSLSSSFAWDQPRYGLLNDRISAPGASGIPRGQWLLEVWVAGSLRASAAVSIGVSTVAAPSATSVASATTVTPDGFAMIGPYTTAPQLLALFDLAGMSGVQRVQWVVFHNSQPVYTSPSIQWARGDGGRFWIGYAPEDGIVPSGTWEFELMADGQIIGVHTVTLF